MEKIVIPENMIGLPCKCEKPADLPEASSGYALLYAVMSAITQEVLK